MRDRLQEKGVQYSNIREQLAKALGCSIDDSSWWDTTSSEKDRQILVRVEALMEQLSQVKVPPIDSKCNGRE